MRQWANDETISCKVADRLHNLRTLPDDYARIKGQVDETEEFILPILEERGMKLEIELLNRELISLKLRLQALWTKNSLEKNLSDV